MEAYVPVDNVSQEVSWTPLRYALVLVVFLMTYMLMPRLIVIGMVYAS